MDTVTQETWDKIGAVLLMTAGVGVLIYAIFVFIQAGAHGG